VENGSSESERPNFKPLACTSCNATIRGSHFSCVEGCVPPNTATGHFQGGNAYFVCEDCGRNGAHQVSHLRKHQKHCILSDAISPRQGQNLCPCRDYDRSETPYPFTETEKLNHASDCTLLSLAPEHVKARYADLVQCKTLAMEKTPEKDRSETLSVLSRTSQRSSLLRRISHYRSKTEGSLPSKRGIAKSILLPAIKSISENIPFGNVHMALCFGPLMIENGVPE